MGTGNATYVTPSNLQMAWRNMMNPCLLVYLTEKFIQFQFPKTIDLLSADYVSHDLRHLA